MTSPIEDERLRECPHCGETRFAKVARYQFPPDEQGGAWEWGFHVICSAAGFDGEHKGCGGSSAWGETAAEAIVAWNRRASPPSILEEAARAAENWPVSKAYPIDPQVKRDYAIAVAIRSLKENGNG